MLHLQLYVDDPAGTLPVHQSGALQYATLHYTAPAAATPLVPAAIL
jgi:hypothetical protein